MRANFYFAKKNIFGKKSSRLRRKGLNLVKLRPNLDFGRTEAEPNTSAEAEKKLRPKPKLRSYTNYDSILQFPVEI